MCNTQMSSIAFQRQIEAQVAYVRQFRLKLRITGGEGRDICRAAFPPSFSENGSEFTVHSFTVSNCKLHANHVRCTS